MKVENERQREQKPISKRVLCFSPYAMMRPHNHWESTILRALEAAGAQVKYVTCHGLSTCDLDRGFNVLPGSPRVCIQCIARVAETMNEVKIDYELLSRYAPPQVKEEVLNWLSQLDPRDFAFAQYKGLPLGDWLRGSIHSYFRVSTLDLDDPEIVRVYREFLLNGAYVQEALNNLLDEFQPDVLFLFNGRMSYPRIALELAKARGIRAITHERGATYGSLMLAENESCAGTSRHRRIWDSWGNVPLLRDELSSTLRLLEDRRNGRNLNWVPFSPEPMQQRERLYQELELASDRPIVALFTSSDEENVSDDDWRQVFGSQIDWIGQTVQLFGALDDCYLIVRVHPNTGSTPGTPGANQELLNGLRVISRTLPPNVRIIWPTDALSTYALMDAADVGLVYGSTAGLEMACLGKPVVVATSCSYDECPFVLSVEHPEDYPSMVQRALEEPPSLETMRLAYRFVYHTFIGMSIPFPLVEMLNVFDSRPTWTSVEDLRMGRDVGLDRVLRCILEDEETYPGSKPEHLLRGTRDEDGFFDKLLPAEITTPRAMRRAYV